MTFNQRFAEDLVVHARQRQLDADEQKALQSWFETSPEARLWYEAGVGFDAESPVLPGDEELLARLVDRVTARRPWRAHSLGRVALPTLGALLIATSAAAGGWAWRQRGVTQVFRPTPIQPQTSGASARSAPRRSSMVASACPAVPSSEPVSGDTVPQPVARALPAAPTAGAERSEAADLFARANRARREGRGAEAMALYQQLCSRMPQSSEAEHANLALGELNLQQGKPAEALRYFQRYRGQAMIPEALWGQARALRQLSRSDEERAVLEILRDRFPNSPYTATALRRLSKE
jgi:TolA-binding protein